ncbi:MAG: hypothetical protein JXK16_06240 [Thiotrichales bacterium]|nr:hypothetical protein [Thiotrichales bacterium]
MEKLFTTKDRVEGFEKFVDYERDDIRRIANELSSLYWAKREEYSSLDDAGNNTLGCRVVELGAGISMSWFHHYFFTKDGKKRRTNVHIKKAKDQNKYNMTALARRCQPHMMEHVEYVESGFAELRKRTELLRKLTATMYYYKLAIGFIDKPVKGAAIESEETVMIEPEEIIIKNEEGLPKNV